MCARYRVLLYIRAAAIGVKTGSTWAFIGIDRATFLEHMLRRYKQGCLICGQPIDGDATLCHIDPISDAKTEEQLRKLHQPENVGFAHWECNKRLRARPIR